MVRIYTNENIPKELADKLRELGYDVLTVKEAGYANKRIPDIDVLKFAISEQRLILTFNKRDFSNLHKKYPDHYGIILCTPDIDLEDLALRIHNSLREIQIIKGKLIRIHKR